ncbi:hypothetical protein GF406_00615 [candidate division KSB1 bacterium]|nr:hypothetical protein [candidate division KSB1 bacterium]
MRFLLSCLILLITLPVIAQEEEGPWAVGPHFAFSIPSSDFANVSGTGEGLGGKLLYRLPSNPAIAARADLTYLSYGEKRQDQYLGGDPYPYLVTTRNESFQLTIGGNFTKQFGRWSFYLAPMGGLYIYRTVVSVPELYYYYNIPASETTESYTKLGYNINAGFMVDINLGPHLDFSVKYQRIPGALETTVETDGGGQEFTIESDAEDFVVSLGVVFFLKQ